MMTQTAIGGYPDGTAGCSEAANPGGARQLLRMLEVADAAGITKGPASDGAAQGARQEHGWRQLSHMFPGNAAVECKIADIMKEVGQQTVGKKDENAASEFGDVAYDDEPSKGGAPTSDLLAPTEEIAACNKEVPEDAHEQILNLRKQVKLLTQQLKQRDLFVEILKTQCIENLNREMREEALKEEEKGKSITDAAGSWFKGFEKLKRDVLGEPCQAPKLAARQAQAVGVPARQAQVRHAAPKQAQTGSNTFQRSPAIPTAAPNSTPHLGPSGPSSAQSGEYSPMCIQAQDTADGQGGATQGTAQAQSTSGQIQGRAQLAHIQGTGTTEKGKGLGDAAGSWFSGFEKLRRDVDRWGAEITPRGDNRAGSLRKANVPPEGERIPVE